MIDFLDDLGLRIVRRGARRWIPALGALLGAAVFVAGSAAGSTTATLVANDFDRLAATTLELRFSDSAIEDWLTPEALDVATERIADLPGVVAVGNAWSAGAVTVATPAGTHPFEVEVLAVSADLLAAAGASVDGPSIAPSGFAFGAPTLVIGTNAAAEFELGVIKVGTPLMLDGRSWSTAGLVTREERQPSLLASLVVPGAAALEQWPNRFGAPRILVEVQPGTVEAIASQARLIVSSADPRSVIPMYRPEATSLRQTVVTRIDSLVLIAGGGLVIVGAFGIATSEVALVLAERREIALRMAMGSTRRAIALLLLAESVMVTGIATSVGALAGLLSFLAWAAIRGVPPVAPGLVVAATPLVGVLVGLLAGIVPAVKGSRVSPAEGVRG